MKTFETNALFIFVDEDNNKFLAHEDRNASDYIELCDWEDLTDEVREELETAKEI